MIEKNMKNYDMKDFNMNRKTLLLACLSALISLSGCALHKTEQPQSNAVYTSADTAVCPQGVCETDPFINYTTTRADFREYGELSSRDHIISQSGAGNNISAAVPPTIESEVISYEEQVNQTSTSASKNTPEESVEEPVVSNEASEMTSPKTLSTQEALAEKSETPADETIVEQTTEEIIVPEEQTQASNEPDDEDPVQDWYAEEGQNLKALLTTWSEESGWRLVWNTNRNYVLNAGAMFRGRFADVSSALIRAFARARPAPVATFYKGNRVLVVETMEDENAFD